MDGFAVDLEGAGIGRMDAGDHLHQGALAGAVLPREAVNGSRPQREIDAAQGLHAAEGLDDVCEFDQRRHGIRQPELQARS